MKFIKTAPVSLILQTFFGLRFSRRSRFSSDNCLDDSQSYVLPTANEESNLLRFAPQCPVKNANPKNFTGGG
jgi:hypothetical protein